MNKGFKYSWFRLFYEIKKRTGLLKHAYPVAFNIQKFITLLKWRKDSLDSLFSCKCLINCGNDIALRKSFDDMMCGGLYNFFSHWSYKLNNQMPWLTNIDTGYVYNPDHWTDISDFDSRAGDIKYVWEMSRFCFLYTAIRYDNRYEEDHSKWVFSKILDWINKNPLNCGPNYICSQETSIRILNWTFALFFYRNSPSLCEETFNTIINSIYWQTRHVYSNINFSRIAVRNNHAITETLALYLIGVIYPFFPEAKKWKISGKRWFEKEVDYQIESDGTYIQNSMNYQRVVVQLLTLAIYVSDSYGETFGSNVYEKAYKMLNFLFQCQNEKDGYLPNYGANDGALFFPLNDNEYRDYRPQLDALHVLLTGKHLYSTGFEDACWFYKKEVVNRKMFPCLKKQYGTICFDRGGYYLIRESDSFTFIRCGLFKGMPGQADNMHIDMWKDGINYLHDAGSFKYNTSNQEIKYFYGSESHNTVMLENNDQMLKGPRFIWYYWPKVISGTLREYANKYVFYGSVNCFRQLGKNIVFNREVIKYKDTNKWIVTDVIKNKPNGLKIRQIWHTRFNNIKFISDTPDMVVTTGYLSEYYGEKKDCKQIEVRSNDNVIKTEFEIL